MSRLSQFLSRESVILWIYTIVTLAIGVPHYLRGPKAFNNFIIYRHSLSHLLEGKNLYVVYPLEYWDLFLYHPSFTVLFAPFSLLPLGMGYLFWLLFCSLSLYFSIKMLPIQYEKKVFVWWFVLCALLNAINSEQTNPLIIALGLSTYTYLEKGNTKWAAFFPILAFCIKGYGLIFSALFLFYPKKGTFIGYSILWVCILSVLPLPFIGLERLVHVYQEWLISLSEDHKVNFGFSIMGLLKLAFPAFSDDNAFQIQILGIILLAITLIQNLRWLPNSPERRLFILGYLAIWVILFNHVSESQTFIIAITGVALCYINMQHPSPIKKLFLWIFIIITIICPLDIFPKSMLPYQQAFSKNLIEVIPCLLAFIIFQYQILNNEIKKVEA